jgi:hypothetical protein
LGTHTGLWLLLILAALALPATLLHAQVTPQPVVLGIVPPSNTAMLTQSVTTVYLTVSNAPLFTNLSAAVFVSTTSPLLDDGLTPDTVAADGTFTGTFLVPAFPAATNFTARFTTIGADIALTNDLGELLPEAWFSNVTRITYAAVIRPNNDNFTNAIKVLSTGGVLTGNNLLATIEPSEPFHGSDPDVSASVWWSWSPTATTRVFIDTAGSSFDPVLAVYTGSSLANLKFVAASTNDVVNNLKANVTFDAKAGATYRIAVAGYDANGAGTIRLTVNPGGAPDTLPPLVNIMYPASQSLFTTNIVRVTGTAKDLDPNATGIDRVTLQLNNDPPVTVTGTTNWSYTVTLPLGTNVITALAEDIAGNVGPPSIVIVRYINPLNDFFADAFPLPNLSGTVTALNDFATLELGEPIHAGNEGGHSIWYWFRAPASGTLQLNTAGSTLDTLLGLYSGDDVAHLTLVAENDDAAPGTGFSTLTASLVRDQVYHIAVDGFGEATGFVQLQYIFTTVETYYSLNLSAGVGGTITPPSGLFLEGSTQVVTALPARDFEFLGWQGSLNTLQNPLTLLMNQNYTLAASFRVISYTDGFESGAFSGRLPWTSYGQAHWQVQSDVAYEGRFAARSGLISNSQSSSLFLQVNLTAGAGAFRVRVSSESGWDGVEFYLNGLLQNRWTGELPWQYYQFAVTNGPNTLEWRYVKDANFSDGLDAAFLDNLYLPLTDQALAAQLGVAALPALGYQVAVQGYPGRTYVLQASPDLRSWTPVQTNSAPSGSWVWVDPLTPLRPSRFYRAILR